MKPGIQFWTIKHEAFEQKIPYEIHGAKPTDNIERMRKYFEMAQKNKWIIAIPLKPAPWRVYIMFPDGDYYEVFWIKKYLPKKRMQHWNTIRCEKCRGIRCEHRYKAMYKNWQMEEDVLKSLDDSLLYDQMTKNLLRCVQAAVLLKLQKPISSVPPSS